VNGKLSNNVLPNNRAFKEMKAQKQLLETLKEMHSGELFAVLKLQDIANNLSRKSGEKYSALKISSMIRRLFGDHVIEMHARAAINIDSLNRNLERFARFKV